MPLAVSNTNQTNVMLTAPIYQVTITQSYAQTTDHNFAHDKDSKG